jgi:hypothetical protein
MYVRSTFYDHFVLSKPLSVVWRNRLTSGCRKMDFPLSTEETLLVFLFKKFKLEIKFIKDSQRNYLIN